jgi:hypothetical protein
VEEVEALGALESWVCWKGGGSGASFPDQGHRYPERGPDEILFCKIAAKKEQPFDKLRVNGVLS